MKDNIVYNHADNVVMVKSQGDKIVIICHSEEQLDQINERFMKKDANVILVDYEEWDEDDDMKWILTYQLQEGFDIPVAYN